MNFGKKCWNRIEKFVKIRSSQKTRLFQSASQPRLCHRDSQPHREQLQEPGRSQRAQLP